MVVAERRVTANTTTVSGLTATSQVRSGPTTTCSPRLSDRLRGRADGERYARQMGRFPASHLASEHSTMAGNHVASAKDKLPACARMEALDEIWHL
jgi:hypothetical protein